MPFHDYFSCLTVAWNFAYIYIYILNFPSFLLVLQAERLSEYEKYFADLVVDTHPDHPDRPHLTRHLETATNVSTLQWERHTPLIVLTAIELTTDYQFSRLLQLAVSCKWRHLLHFPKFRRRLQWYKINLDKCIGDWIFIIFKIWFSNVLYYLVN